MFGPFFFNTVREIIKRKLLESVSCVLWLPSPWAQMSTGKVEIKLEEIKTHFVFQSLVIKNSCCRWVLRLSLIPLIIRQKQNPTKIETNAEICSGFFFCVPMFLLVKSHYGAIIKQWLIFLGPKVPIKDVKGWSIKKQDGMRALSLWVSVPQTGGRENN